MTKQELFDLKEALRALADTAFSAGLNFVGVRLMGCVDYLRAKIELMEISDEDRN